MDVILVEAEEYQQFPDVLALLQQSFEYMQGRIDPESSLNRLDVNKIRKKAATEYLYIVHNNGLLVACVFAAPRKDHVYLGKLAVRSDYRRRGLARTLVSQVEALAIQLELPEVEIETRIELVENQRLFERLGYRRTAEKSHPGYDRPTSVCYRKRV